MSLASGTGGATPRQWCNLLANVNYALDSLCLTLINYMEGQ